MTDQKTVYKSDQLDLNRIDRLLNKLNEIGPKALLLQGDTPLIYFTTLIETAREIVTKLPNTKPAKKTEKNPERKSRMQRAKEDLLYPLEQVWKRIIIEKNLKPEQDMKIMKKAHTKILEYKQHKLGAGMRYEEPVSEDYDWKDFFRD